jgi:hypothetical protein
LSIFSSFNFKKANLIVVIVYDAEGASLTTEREKLLASIDPSLTNVDVRCFSYADLSKKFGVSPDLDNDAAGS